MREEDIRKREVLNRYLELVRIDAQEIFNDQSDFVTSDCIACGSDNYSFQFEKFGFPYVLCQECDTLFANPRPSHNGLMKFYANSPSTKFWIEDFFLPMVETRRKNIFRPRAQHISSYFPDLKDAHIGDIGSGFGIFLEELKQIWHNAHLYAIEPSAQMASICRDKGLNVIEAMFEDMDADEQKFDLLTSFELFEHLSGPDKFIKKIHTLLSPGGYLYLTTLNGMGFDIQIFWEYSKSVFPPHHLNFFNPQSIRHLLTDSGFEVVEASTPGELDWDIVESAYKHEHLEPGRFFRTLARYGSDKSKGELQNWLKQNNLSSHMRVIARKRRKQ